MTGNGSPLDGIGRFSIVSLSFRVCAKANVGLMRAAPTPAASRKKLVRDKSLVSKDFELRRIVKRFLCTWSCCWDHDVLATAPTHGYAETREAAMAAFAKSWRTLADSKRCSAAASAVSSRHCALSFFFSSARSRREVGIVSLIYLIYKRL